MNWETVIGLEIHVQLSTKSKIFSGASAVYGSEQNTNTSLVDLGYPGVLPVLNKEAVMMAIKFGLAIEASIAERSIFARKNYFYPDLPKGYQISQYELPIVSEGSLTIRLDDGTDKRIGVTRAHLEEDAGKSIHDMFDNETAIDLNRAGTPLLEIVSEPELSSAKEASLYMQKMHQLVRYLKISDGNMQEGSLRCDANVNLHITTDDGVIATPIVEIKNMNSFRSVERGIEYEAKRQYDVWQETGKVLGELPKQTRGWDDSAQVTRSQREKEESADYRYFPCPDLVPVIVTDQQIEEVRQEIGELPSALRERLQNEFGLTVYTADVIVNQGLSLVEYYLELAAAAGDNKLAGNWVQGEVLRILNDQEIEIEDFPIDAGRLAELLKLVQAGDLDSSKAKDVFAAMLTSDSSAADVIKELGIEKVDEGALEALCQVLVERNQRIVDDVKSGNEKAVGALIGQAKKENPNVNPGQVRQICLEIINNL